MTQDPKKPTDIKIRFNQAMTQFNTFESGKAAALASIKNCISEVEPFLEKLSKPNIFCDDRYNGIKIKDDLHIGFTINNREKQTIVFDLYPDKTVRILSYEDIYEKHSATGFADLLCNAADKIASKYQLINDLDKHIRVSANQQAAKAKEALEKAAKATDDAAKPDNV